MSINELIIKQIQASYYILRDSGSIPPCAKYSEESLESFKEMLESDVSGDTILRLIKLNMDPVLKERKDFLYMKNELKGMGFKYMEELEPNNKAYL